MKPRTWKLLSTEYTVCAALVAYVVVNRIVKEPYMDELIHIPQAQAYCEGKFDHWDPALTTPPGLYLTSPMMGYMIPRTRSWFCSVAGLRHGNLMLLLYLPWVISSNLWNLRAPPPPKDKGEDPTPTTTDDLTYYPEAVILATFPIAWFFGLLYYTEIGSLVLVLMSYRYGLESKWLRSSLAGAVSLLFRQTNIIWLVFTASTCIIRFLSRQPRQSSRRLRDPRLGDAILADIPASIISLLDVVLHSLPTLLAPFAAYLPTFFGALAFVKWNGGIALGDKSHHVPTLHLVQPLYFFAFSAAFLSPYLLNPRRIKRSLYGLVGPPARFVSTLVLLGAALYCIKYHTIVHPFTLADNRHYTFYIWRRVMNAFPGARYALAPGYILAGRMLFDLLAEMSDFTVLQTLLLSIATSLVLIPSPLIEPRYFLIPYVLIRLHLRPRLAVRSAFALEVVWYALVNVVTLYVFLMRPFKVEHEGTVKWSRFMW